jgi:hypothetical protein
VILFIKSTMAQREVEIQTINGVIETNNEETTALIEDKKVSNIKKFCKQCKYFWGFHTWNDENTCSGMVIMTTLFVLCAILFLIFCYLSGLLFDLIIPNEFWLTVDKEDEGRSLIIKAIIHGVTIWVIVFFSVFTIGAFIFIMYHIIKSMKECWQESGRLANEEKV